MSYTLPKSTASAFIECLADPSTKITRKYVRGLLKRLKFADMLAFDAAVQPVGPGVYDAEDVVTYVYGPNTLDNLKQTIEVSDIGASFVLAMGE